MKTHSTNINGYTAIIQWNQEAQSYITSFPLLPHCMSDGETIKQAIQEATIASNLWLKTAKDMGRPIPSPNKNTTQYPITLQWSADDHAWIATAPDLPGCKADGSTKEQALQHIQPIITMWIQEAKRLKRPIPTPTSPQ